MGNLITQQFLRAKKSYKAPKCSKMALDLECTNTGMNCTFVWVFSKERTQTLGGQKVVKSIESEAVHANVILNETSVYTDRKRIWVRLSLQLSIFFILLIKDLFSALSH